MSSEFPSVTDWTLSLQQELPVNLILELNYSGSAARHLPIFNQDLNRFSGDLIVNRGSLSRLNPNFGDITYGSSDGNSTGHYGSAVLAERLAHGFSMRGIYTFGKALDTFSTSGSLDTGQATSLLYNVIQNGDLGAQRGRSDFDIRQQLSIDGTWAVPSTSRGALCARRMAVRRGVDHAVGSPIFGLHDCALQRRVWSHGNRHRQRGR